jgi:hypothetical protein
MIRETKNVRVDTEKGYDFQVILRLVRRSFSGESSLRLPREAVRMLLPRKGFEDVDVDLQ